jgi:hypothetical protein
VAITPAPIKNLRLDNLTDIVDSSLLILVSKLPALSATVS